ncbi:MAG: hypothetical protein ACREIT_06575 [Tepidisphaeraceae bacterium]
MTFASPIWLIALAPWAALAWWMLRGRAPRVDVPFVDLWRGPAGVRRPRRAVERPPLATALVLAALLLAVLAAARPTVEDFTGRAHVTIVVDRGVTMSAQSRGGTSRLGQAVDAASPELAKHFGGASVDLVAVPGDQTRTNAAEWSGLDGFFAPALQATGPPLADVVRRKIAENQGPVIVFSDQAPGAESDRLVLVPPSAPARNIGVVSVAAREHPSPAMMVRLRNQSGQTGAASLQIVSGDRTVTRPIDLPRRDTEADYFIDIQDALADVTTVEILTDGDDDDLPADDRAWVARTRSWPRIETATVVPLALRRMIEVYADARPPAGSSRVVRVVSDGAVPADASPVVVIGAGAGEPASRLEPHAHPVVENVDWSALADARAAGQAPPGWAPVLIAGGRTLVAVTEQPARRVWVGFESESFPRSPAFVVFWTDLFDWVGEGGQTFSTDAPTPPGYEPNVLGVRFPELPMADWRVKLANLRKTTAPRASVTPILVLAALACLVGAGWTWPGGRAKLIHNPGAGVADRARGTKL